MDNETKMLLQLMIQTLRQAWTLNNKQTWATTQYRMFGNLCSSGAYNLGASNTTIACTSIIWWIISIHEICWIVNFNFTCWILFHLKWCVNRLQYIYKFIVYVKWCNARLHQTSCFCYVWHIKLHQHVGVYIFR
jgi:hypothetical protein